MSEFNKGDRVRVTFEGTYYNQSNWSEPGGHVITLDGAREYNTATPANAVVELVKPVDDPSTDPIGTVRAAHTMDAAAWVKLDERCWRFAGHDGGSRAFINETMPKREIVGAVPNTPAWEAWRQGTLRGAPPFPGSVQVRELWTGDGSEEPPAHVKKVRDKDGTHLVRNGTGWSGLDGDANGWALNVKPWGSRWEDEYAPHVEVLDQ